MEMNDAPGSKKILNPDKAQVVANAGKNLREEADLARIYGGYNPQTEKDFDSIADHREDRAGIEYDVDQLAEKMDDQEIEKEVIKRRTVIDTILAKEKPISDD